MSDRPRLDLDLVLPAWLAEAGEPRHVDYLGDVLARTKRTRQRPAWTFPGRWFPHLATGWTFGLSPTLRLLLLLGLLLGLMAGMIAVGGMRHLPAPYGLARPGLVALDIDNHIAVMNADGSGRRQVTSGDAVDTSPVWSPDGTRLAFWRATGIGHWTIVIADASGLVRASVAVAAPTPLPLPSGDPAWQYLAYPLGAPSFLEWSPDSNRLAFSQDVGGSPRVFTLEADGSGLMQVGDPNVQARYPTWSSDGTRIAFRGADSVGGNSGVWVMNVDGTDARRITSVEASGDSFSYPQWQPGGELIAFIADPGGLMHIFVVRSDGTGERDISAAVEGDGTSDWIQRWSPDGTRVAYQHYDNAHPNGEIRITDPDGLRTLTPAGQPQNVGGPVWSPDGRTVSALLYGPEGSTGFVSLDVTGMRPPVIVSAAGNQGGTSWQRLAP